MVDRTNAERLAAQHGTPTLFLSAARLRENYRALRQGLSRVELYYAVKSNPVPELLSILAAEGACFDIATSGEIELIRSRGIAPQRCIHTHPVKTDAEIRAALDYGIDTFVADNDDELEKFAPYRDRAKILVRMSIQNPACVVNLSAKFGAKPWEVFGLLKRAHGRGLRVAGVSFHVGSQSENSLKYIEALEYCRDIFRTAALAGTKLDIIDIGGGFPINYLTGVMPVAQFCQPINEYVERYFANYRIIAEPGRFISGPAVFLAAGVVGKSRRDGVWWYYLDDGVYGSFSGKIYDHADYPMVVFKSGERHTSTIAGPTCDSIDVLYENIALPELDIGDVLFFESMGAYTLATSTTFNGIPKTKVVVIE